MLTMFLWGSIYRPETLLRYLDMLEFFANLVVAMVLFLVSIPLHELSHLLFLKIISTRPQAFKVHWLKCESLSDSYELGSVELVGGEIEVSDFWQERVRLFFFLSGFSGGFGATFFLSFLFLLLIPFPSLNTYFTIPLLAIMAWQFLYGIWEGLERAKKQS